MSQIRIDRLAILASSKRQIGEIEAKRNDFESKKPKYVNNVSATETINRAIKRFDAKIAEMWSATKAYERSIL